MPHEDHDLKLGAQAALQFYADVFVPELHETLASLYQAPNKDREQALVVKDRLVSLHERHRYLLTGSAARLMFDRYAVARVRAEFAKIDARLAPSK